MSNKIVADGYARLLRGQRALRTESSRKQSAPGPAAAGADEPAEIRQHVTEEFRRRKKMADHNPSAGSWW